jgi:hypothetical protein
LTYLSACTISRSQSSILSVLAGQGLKVWSSRPFRAKLERRKCSRRQETPHCTSVSFERHAANAFQSYVSGALAFSIKRGGILYGNVDEEGKAVVEVIYEPEQVGFCGKCVVLCCLFTSITCCISTILQG